MPIPSVQLILRDQATGREIRTVIAPGESILRAATAAGMPVEHTCGGVGACSTCHVWIEQGENLLNRPDDNEWDHLEQAADLQLNSRLSCQAHPKDGTGTIVCVVPRWNRNAIKETPLRRDPA